MTTKVTIEPAGHHVLVVVTDKVQQTLLQPASHLVEGKVVPTGQGPWMGYATTTRSIYALDLEPDDPRVLAANGQNNAPVA